MTTKSIQSVHLAFGKRKQERVLSSQCKSQSEKAFLVTVCARLIHPKTPPLAERIKAALRLINFEMVCDNRKQDSFLLCSKEGLGPVSCLIKPDNDQETLVHSDQHC